MEEKLPEGWVRTTLGTVAAINPGIDASILDDLTSVSFVPMAAVEAGTGKMDSSNIRKFSEVKKGYTAFQENDVLFAKITPCMENGKIAVAQNLSSSIGFGSTEFHVLRPEKEINPHLLYYFLSQETFRRAAQTAMTGSAGQLRVPATFLLEASYPLAPSSEQNRIVAAIEQQFTRLDNAVASLQSAKARAKQYRASLLKAAVEGEPTKEWRAAHPTGETGAQLLARILDERRARWEEEQLAKMRERGITPRDDKWKREYKEPQGPDVEQLPELSEGWCWASLDQLSWHVTSGSRGWAQYYANSGSLFIRVGNFNRLSTEVDLQKVVFVKAPASPEADRCRLQMGDLLLTITADVGMVGVVDKRVFQWGEAYINQHVGLVRFLYPELTVFAALALTSEPMQKQIRDKQYGATKIGLGLEDVRALTVPLPPLAEQEQIVAEVEARLSSIEQMEETIEISLRRAEQERQSILREAFAGRLVSQNPEDEPASVLLERILEERKRREEEERVTRKGRKDRQMAMAKKRRTGKAGLYATLVEAGRPLPPDDLFKRAGLNADEQHESVEAFYEELQADVEDRLIAETPSDYGQVLLQALEPSAEVLARMQEEEAATRAQEAEQSEKPVDAPVLWDIELPDETHIDDR